MYQLAMDDVAHETTAKLYLNRKAPAGSMGISGSEYNPLRVTPQFDDSDYSDVHRYSDHYVEVAVTSLDLFRARNGLQNEEVFMLKIDTEGKDAEVLAGAQQMLEETYVPLILWEYGQFYLTAADDVEYSNLRDTSLRLDDLGYDSYLLGLHNAVRLNGNCWTAEYEMWSWSDVLSVRRDFAFNRDFLRLYNVGLDAAHAWADQHYK